VALSYAYNFIKIHGTLRTTPAMAGGVTGELWGTIPSHTKEEDTDRQMPLVQPSNDQDNSNGTTGSVKKRRDFSMSAYEVTTLIITGIGVAAAVGAIVIYGLQLDAMRGQLRAMEGSSADTRTLAEAAKTQADDLRAQMRATMPAIVNFSIGLSNQKVEIAAENHGRFRATKVGGKITITRQTLPDQRQIGEPGSYDVVLRDLDGFPQAGQQTAQHGTNKDFEIPGFTTKDMEAVMRTEQTVTVEGTFRYDDGLGEIHESTQCVSFVWSPMMVNINGAGMAYRGFQECQQLAASLKTIQQWKKEQAERPQQTP
jgi:hypothetical protein